MFARPGLCGLGIGRLGLVAASRPGLVAQALAILAKYGSAANLYLPGVGAINGITAGNWLDSAGTTAATVDNPVGLVVSAGKAIGPELVTDGTFDNGTNGWISDNSAVISSIGSNLRVTHGGTPNPYVRQSISTVIGRTYSYSVTVRTTSSSALTSIRAGTSNGGSQNFISSSLTGARTVIAYFVATSASTVISLLYLTSTPGDFADFDDVSVKEMPGAHLTQSTAANRPILRRGLVNLVLSSGDMSSSSWTAGKSAGATVGSWTTGPDGQQSARLVTYSTANEYLYQGFVSYQATAGQSVTMAIVCNTATRAGGFGGGSPSGTDVFTAYNMGGGWWLQTVVRTFTVTTSANTLQTLPGSVFGLGAATVAYHRVGLFQGTVTAQQILDAGSIPLTTTAPASSTNGPFAWQFDGSNDSFASTLTPGNAGFFCASANVTDSGVLRTLLGAGASSDLLNGVSLFRNANNAIQLFVGDGMKRNNVSAAYPVATNSVASAGWDASTMFVGVGNTETSSSKSVNCETTRVINVGNQSGIFMFGTIGATIIMPTVLPTATERATLRQFIASLSGVTM